MSKEIYLKWIEETKSELEINPDLGDEELWVCSECGSLNIEEKMWVKINNGQITDHSENGLDCYCNNCEEHTSQLTLKEYLSQYE